MKGKFATVINCIDGRVQNPVIEWMKKNLGVDYVDMLTEPGPDRALTQGVSEFLDSIRKKILISVNAHGSDTVAIVAHHDCAGNPVSKQEHMEQIKKCLEVVKSWNLPAMVMGLWVNEQWQVEMVRVPYQTH